MILTTITCIRTSKLQWIDLALRIFVDQSSSKEVPYWWYMIVLVVSFVFGLVVVVTQDVTLPWWGYIISLIVGSIIAPFVSLSLVNVHLPIPSNSIIVIIELHSLCTLRKRHRHQQSL